MGEDFDLRNDLAERSKIEGVLGITSIARSETDNSSATTNENCRRDRDGLDIEAANLEESQTPQQTEKAVREAGPQYQCRESALTWFRSLGSLPE